MAASTQRNAKSKLGIMMVVKIKKGESAPEDAVCLRTLFFFNAREHPLPVPPMCWCVCVCETGKAEM